jgi:hypothetical protein
MADDVKYLFNSNLLYPKHSLAYEDTLEVEPLTLEATNIRPSSRSFIGSPQWEFQIVGHGDTVYLTSYDWALVENTPENLVLLAEYARLNAQREEVLRQVSDAFNQIKKIPVYVSPDNQGNEHESA